MTTIMASALRPIRLNGPRALRLGATAESAHAQSRAHPVSRRSAATYTTPPKPAPPRSPVSQSTYKRSATTSTNSYSSPSAPKPSTSTSPSYSSSPSSSTTSAPSAKPATSPAKGENQTSSVSPAYSQPPGVGPIPETGNGAASSDPAFGGNGIDWSSSFHGLSTNPFSPEVAAVLMAPLPFDDVEIKPDGIIYLPEIKYRRILNQAFGPGGWGMAPRGDLGVGDKVVTREYALLVHGRYVYLLSHTCIHAVTLSSQSQWKTPTKRDAF